MDETKKPFACRFAECEMSFTNEDHLSVHTKKHAMCLQLSLCSKAASFVADQTPTPTRLIRNCDEVGLFEDLHLQHVNPFEETFRRAVETKSFDDFSEPVLKQGNEEFIKSSGEDSLHTPRVLPLSDTNRTCSSNVEYSRQMSDTNLMSEAIVECPTTNSNFKDREHKKTSSRVKSKPVRRLFPKCNRSSSVPSAVQVVSLPQLVQIASLPSVGARQYVQSNQTEQTNSHVFTTAVQKTVREKLKERILKARRVVETIETQKRIIPIETKKNTVGTFKSIAIVPPTDEKRRKFEGNREAAKRYRKKMKTWNTETHLKNLKLEAENRQLRAELDQTKSLLLAHQNCPVTKAMSMGHYIPVGPPTVIVKPPKEKSILPLVQKSQLTQKNGINSNQIYVFINSSGSTNENNFSRKS